MMSSNNPNDNTPEYLQPDDCGGRLSLSHESGEVPYGKLIAWENNVPVPVYVPPVTKGGISQMMHTALSMPYMGQYDQDTGEYVDIEPRFVGLTNLEVMTIRAAEKGARGSLKAMDMLLDRTLGKPKQEIESKVMTLTYQDVLDTLEAVPPLKSAHPVAPDTPAPAPTDDLLDGV